MLSELYRQHYVAEIAPVWRPVCRMGNHCPFMLTAYYAVNLAFTLS